MYMQPIVRAKPPVSLARRRLTGTALVLAGIVVMLPWLALWGSFAALTLAVRGLVALPATFRQMVDHVGDYAHGL